MSDRRPDNSAEDALESTLPELRTIEGFLEFQRLNAEKRIRTCARKNSDYADAASAENEGDPYKVFRNFIAVEKLGICTAETGLLVRLTDKFVRTVNLIKKAERGEGAAVVDESVVDTILDAQNYFDLLHGYLALVDLMPAYEARDRAENIVKRSLEAVDDDGAIRVGRVRVKKDPRDGSRDVTVEDEEHFRLKEAAAARAEEAAKKRFESAKDAVRKRGGKDNASAPSLRLTAAGDLVAQRGWLRFVRFHDDSESVVLQTLVYPFEEEKPVLRWKTLKTWPTEYFDALTRDRVALAEAVSGVLEESAPHVKVGAVSPTSRLARMHREPLLLMKVEVEDDVTTGPPHWLIRELRDDLRLDEWWAEVRSDRDSLKRIMEEIEASDDELSGDEEPPEEDGAEERE